MGNFINTISGQRIFRNIILELSLKFYFIPRPLGTGPTDSSPTGKLVIPSYILVSYLVARMIDWSPTNEKDMHYKKKGNIIYI